MAITNTQRSVALTQILQSLNSPSALAQLLPGVSAAQIISFILTAIGSNADAQLTTAMNNMAAAASANLAAAQAGIPALQAEVTAWTVV